jgi:hypothetical protein
MCPWWPILPKKWSLSKEVVTKQAQQGEPGGHKPERISHQGPIPWPNSRFPSFKNQVSSIELEWGIFEPILELKPKSKLFKN